MEYDAYRNARDAAWQLLMDSGAQRLPVKLGPIVKLLGVKVIRYDHAANMLKNRYAALMAKTDGFTRLQGNTYIIYYDDKKTKERQRFTVAHEIGHIILGHLSPGQVTQINREPSPQDDPLETAANVVAARILAPACVLHAARIMSAPAIAAACGISLQAAQFRAERLRLLEARDQHFQQINGHGCFFQSPLERAVYAAFNPYIKETINPDHQTAVQLQPPLPRE